MDKWIFLAAGIYLVVHGLTAKFFIHESEIPATEEERKEAKPIVMKRVVIIIAGLAACIYSVVKFSVDPSLGPFRHVFRPDTLWKTGILSAALYTVRSAQ